ncbi:SAM-dependent methyltransferase [Telmatospirillum siberiense]|uniref:SAM-dependent methyltransferase n=2 Tax=Telmatospirillum siberiense TaxID=382514 RepID=A0A2N3PT70_9PROT|nr:SAM-dependent methyltransferase [Telmatospirillum siberiense]
MVWDERFMGEEYVYGTEPNVFLTEQAPHLVSGARVLVPGDGEGRNGVWLAGRGMRVLSVDGSTVGLAKARNLAASRGLVIETEVADLGSWEWPVGKADAVASLFLHLPTAVRPQIHAKMIGALRPGGLLILEAFRPAQLAYASGGPKDLDLLYAADQLRSDFQAMDMLLLEEVLTELDEGALHRGPAATVRMVARKP